MSLEHINPDTLFPAVGFSQVVKARGRTTVYCSGQVAFDRDRNVVGKGDLAAQAHQALRNVNLALEAAGAGLADVAMLRIYIVDLDDDRLRIFAPVYVEYVGEPAPASTLIGVKALAAPELLIEVEAIAVLDD